MKKNKKKIKVQFTDWMQDGKLIIGATYKNIVLKSLEKNYEVIISDKPEICFFSMWGKRYEYSKYDCIRVYVSFENPYPNFNICDYAIGMWQGLELGDRVFSDVAPIISDIHKEYHNLALHKHEKIDENFLEKKKFFCSYVQSGTSSEVDVRKEFFEKLSKYKCVNSAGRHLNNMGYTVNNKYLFELEHKFSMAFFNLMAYTYQDRPTHAFAARTVPIFWGNPDMNVVFNSKAYINCHEYVSFDDVIERVKEIDSNDELYLQMMREPAFLKPETADEIEKRFDDFLINIVENGTRCRPIARSLREEKIAFYGQRRVYQEDIIRKKIGRVLAITGRPLRKTVFAEKMRRIVFYK